MLVPLHHHSSNNYTLRPRAPVKPSARKVKPGISSCHALQPKPFHCCGKGLDSTSLAEHQMLQGLQSPECLSCMRSRQGRTLDTLWLHVMQVVGSQPATPRSPCQHNSVRHSLPVNSKAWLGFSLGPIPPGQEVHACLLPRGCGCCHACCMFEFAAPSLQPPTVIITKVYTGTTTQKVPG